MVNKCAVIILNNNINKDNILSLLSATIDNLTSNKVNNIMVFYNNDFNKNIDTRFSKQNLDIKFIRTDNNNLDIIKTLDYSNDIDYIVINSNDSLNLDYNKIYNKHKDSNNTITVVCGINNIVIPYDILEIDNTSQISYFEENPKFTFTVNLNIYVINSSIIPFLDGNIKSARKLLNVCANRKNRIGTFLAPIYV